MMKQDFKADFYEVLRMIRESESFALSRFADGEASILKNKTVGNKDGWLYKEDRNLVFRADLRRSLLCEDSGFNYGISCTCCDEENHRFLLSQLKTELKNVTFSNIWVNSNFDLFNQHFLKTLHSSKRPIVICTNKKAKIRNLEPYIRIDDFIPVPGNCIKYWQSNKDYIKGLLDLKGTTHKNAVFLFAVGPLSEILIHELWKVNPDHISIDIGSTLDPYLFNRKSRSYHHQGHEFAQRTCVW